MAHPYVYFTSLFPSEPAFDGGEGVVGDVAAGGEVDYLAAPVLLLLGSATRGAAMEEYRHEEEGYGENHHYACKAGAEGAHENSEYSQAERGEHVLPCTDVLEVGRET